MCVSKNNGKVKCQGIVGWLFGHNFKTFYKHKESQAITAGEFEKIATSAQEFNYVQANKNLRLDSSAYMVPNPHAIAKTKNSEGSIYCVRCGKSTSDIK